MIEAVLAVHVAVICSTCSASSSCQIGAVRNWRFVHVRWWRVLHVLLLAAVAAQAVAGQACFLTVWQDTLAAAAQPSAPLLVRWINDVIYWQLPIWVFAAVYALVFVYALALLWLVPPRRLRSEPS